MVGGCLRLLLLFGYCLLLSDCLNNLSFCWFVFGYFVSLVCLCLLYFVVLWICAL